MDSVMVRRALDLYGSDIEGCVGSSEGCFSGQRSSMQMKNAGQFLARGIQVCGAYVRSSAISENGFSSAAAASASESTSSSSSSSPSESYRGGLRCRMYRV